MLHRLLLFYSLFAALLTSGCGREDARPDAETEAAVASVQPVDLDSLLATGRLDELIVASKQMVQHDPSYPKPYSYLAASYASLGLFDEADDWLRRRRQEASEAYYPGHFQCWEGWKVNAVRGDRAALAENIDSLLTYASSENPFPWACASRLERYLGRYGKAKMHLERFVDETQQTPLRPSEVAFLAQKTGEEDRAEALLAEGEVQAREEIAENQEDWRPHLALSEIEAIRGNQDESFEHLREAVRRGARMDFGFYYRLSGETMGDPMFERLRGDPQFEQVMGEIRTDLERMRERVLQEDS